MYRAKPNMTMKKIEIAPGTILDVFVALHFSANCVIGGDQREAIDHVCRVVVFVVVVLGQFLSTQKAHTHVDVSLLKENDGRAVGQSTSE